MHREKPGGTGHDASRGRATGGGPRAPRSDCELSLPDAIVAALDGGGSWCVLRDADAGSQLPEVDLLVSQYDRGLQSRLAAAGAAPLRSWGRRPHHFHVVPSADGRGPLKLDLVEGLAFGLHHELEVDAGDEVLRRSWRDGAVARPDPIDDQWMLLLHLLLDRRALRPEDPAKLTAWAPGVQPAGPVVARLTPGLIGDLDSAIAAGAWGQLELLRPRLAAELRAGQAPAATARAQGRKLLRRTTKVQRALLRPGTRLAVLGPDGAGKTTTIRALEDEGIAGHTVYLGVAPQWTRGRGGPPGADLARTVGRLWRGWIVATYHRRRGRHVVLDRHPTEAEIGPPTRKRRTRFRRALLARCIPQPDAVVVLDAPAELLHERKPEHDLAEVVARRERYVSLAAEKGWPVIDTTLPVEDVVREVEALVPPISGIIG